MTSYLGVERLRSGTACASSSSRRRGLDVPIPPFAIQPLVENAIDHAIAPRASADGGVSARRSRGGCARCGTTALACPEAASWRAPRLGLRLLRERLATPSTRARRASLRERRGADCACFRVPPTRSSGGSNYPASVP